MSLEQNADVRTGMLGVAKAGYAARGLVYIVMGGLALLVALGEGGRVTDSHGALNELGAVPWVGRALLYASGVGLACYALWSVARAAFDPTCRDDRRSVKRVFARIGYGLSAITQGFLSVYAFRLALGARSQHGGTRSAIARTLAEPFGRYAVLLLGAIFIAFGVFQLYRAIRDKLGSDLESVREGLRDHRYVLALARVGLAARGVVFPVMGVSFVSAALHARAREAKDVAGALREVHSHPLGGPVLLGLVAGGLVAYGITQLFVARYARLEPRSGRG